jgi:carboxymethylenebutenolidase
MRTLPLLTLLTGLGAGVLLARRDGPAPLPADGVTTHGEYVAFVNAKGDSVRAYVAYPERQGKAPAIIVIHENRGLTDWEPTVADEYAKKGYVAIAPDLLSSRYGSAKLLADSVTRMIGTLKREDVVADLDATYKWITAQPATNKERVGVIGFCWGGGTVWSYASSNPNLKAAVVCYGPLADTMMLRSVKAPVLGVYGQNDGRVNNSLPLVAAQMQALGKSFTADSYPGTGHGFLKPGRMGNGTPAAAKAQADIDAFFAKQLEGK